MGNVYIDQGKPSIDAAEPTPEVSVTVEGRFLRIAAFVLITLTLGAGAFGVGRIVSSRSNSEPPGELAARQAAGSEAKTESALPGEETLIVEGNGDDGSPAASAPASLRFVAFDAPMTLIDAASDPELNNSVGVDTTTLDGGDGAAAVVSDLTVTGPAGTMVSVHPGDRPSDGISFTLPANGRLLIPHLISATDDAGRVLVTASDEVEVTMNGLGVYRPAERSSAGRFVQTKSVRLGSLVTATDGRELVVSLGDLPDIDPAHVGHVVLRLNANVGPNGGSVIVGSGPPLPWPAPPTTNPGLGGTELVTAAPDDAGEIILQYFGGSVMTVDLVGYYTNDDAPESTEGLLVLSPQPELQTIEAAGADLGLTVDDSPFSAEDVEVSSAVVTIEAANAQTAGAIAFWVDGEAVPSSPSFALAADQVRATTEWLNPSGSSNLLQAPDGSVLRVWTVGGLL